MEEKDAPKWQFGEDNSVHDEMLHDELQELKMEKLSHRVTLLTVLIPCMIGIILIIAYLDIKDRVTRTQDTGTFGVQKLAKDIESKFSSLSVEQAKIKDTLSSKLPSLENSSAFVQSRLKNMQNSLKRLESSSISRDELSQALQDMNDKYSEIPAALKTELQNLKTTDRQLAENMEKLSDRFDQLSESLREISDEMERIDESIAAMEAQNISKSELDLALRLKEIATKQSILEAATSLEKKINSLEEEIRVIQKDVNGAREKSQNKGIQKSGSVKEGATRTLQTPENSHGSSAQIENKPSDAQSAPVPVQSEEIVEETIE